MYLTNNSVYILMKVSKLVRWLSDLINLSCRLAIRRLDGTIRFMGYNLEHGHCLECEKEQCKILAPVAFEPRTYGVASWPTELLCPRFKFHWFQFVHCFFSSHFRLIYFCVLDYKL